MADKTAPAEPTGYQPFFGLPKDGSKKPVPKWVPLTLLAFSTAAMVVPIVLLRRHRAAALGKALAAAPPPPPRATTSARGAPIAHPTAKPPVFSIRDPVSSSAGPSSAKAGRSMGAGAAGEGKGKGKEEDFNGALHCAKAFGIATLLVSAGAAVGVYGVKRYTGVQSTQEFAERMRAAVLARLPVLSARIHRAPMPEDDETILPLPSPTSQASTPPSPRIALDDSTSTAPGRDTEEWSWPAAEARLKAAFDANGFYGWAEAAMRELEAEGRVERAKRGHA